MSEDRITPSSVEDEDLYMPPSRAARGTGARTLKGKENATKATLRLTIDGANTGVIIAGYGVYKLDDLEVDQLVDALFDVVRINPAVMKWLTRATKITPYGKLLLVLYTIGSARVKLYLAIQNGPIAVPDGVLHSWPKGTAPNWSDVIDQ